MRAYEQKTQVEIARKAYSTTITLGQMKSLSSNQMRILRITMLGRQEFFKPS
jgi:hypothetical protein